MSKKFALYQAAILPVGFIYPEAFRLMVDRSELPEIYPWWFIDANTEAGELFFSTRTDEGLNLIPFAKIDADVNDIACFDGDDTSGNPRVIMLVLEDTGRNYSFEDFDSWLVFAKNYASRLSNFLGA